MLTITVFIENPAGSTLKHHYDERRLVLQRTTPVSRPYPFHYGFIRDTAAADGDCLDCFVLSARAQQSGDVVECAVIGLLEQWEDGLSDHNVLACPAGESARVDAAVQSALSVFVAHVFEHIPGKRVRAGRFLDAQAAARHIAAGRLAAGRR